MHGIRLLTFSRTLDNYSVEALVECALHSVFELQATEPVYLALVDARVSVRHPLEDEDPVDGLCGVEDLEPVVGREEQVAVAQDVKVAPANERNLEKKIGAFTIQTEMKTGIIPPLHPLSTPSLAFPPP